MTADNTNGQEVAETQHINEQPKQENGDHQVETKANEVAEEVSKVLNSSVFILDNSKDFTWIYNSKTKQWQSLKITLPIQMHTFGSVVLNDEIYIFGGYMLDKKQYDLASCYKLQNNGKWKKMADMREKRRHIQKTSVVFQDEIWVIGGANKEKGKLKYVEKYNPSTNKWTAMPETNIERWYSSAAVLNEKIYVAGGHGRAARSVEVFDVELQKWTLFSAISAGFTAGHCMLALDDCLMLLGGYDRKKKNYSNHVWKLNPNESEKEKKWTKMAKLNEKRSHFVAVNIASQMMIFGGNAKSKDLDSSEIFDGETWTEGPKLLKEMSFKTYTALSQSLEEKLLKKFS